MATRAFHPLLRRVGSRLRKARLAKGITQQAVSDSAEMDLRYVSGLERGEFNVSLVALAKIARALDVRLASLFEDE